MMSRKSAVSACSPALTLVRSRLASEQLGSRFQEPSPQPQRFAPGSPRGYAHCHRGGHDMSDQDGSRLIGTWRLISAYIIIQETGERTEIFGSDPHGCIIVAPGGRMMAL